MSLDKIHHLISSLAKNVEDNQKIATPILAAKLAKCLESYPHDQTIGSMSRVISKLASNNTLFIKKADLKALYTKLHSRNTKFAELFQEELGVVDSLPLPVERKKDESATSVQAYHGDEILTNALSSAFDSSIPLKMYSQSAADKAKVSVASTLDSWNLKPAALNVDIGNDKFLVIKADYETPKGITSFYIPVETRNNKISEASIFMGNTGPQDLNHVSIKSYLTSNAGNKLKVSANNILSVLTTAASENREVSATEIALIKLNSKKRGESEFFQNQIVGQQLDVESIKDVELPKSDEFSSFENSFTSSQGIASFQFGADKVKTARENIVRELAGFGYKNAQVAVSNVDSSTIFYGVSLDAGKVGFTVPVKIANDKINKPSVILYNGSINSFTKDSINEIYVNNQSDYKAAASASPLFSLSNGDLINTIKKAMSENNNEKAEDALNVLFNNGDTVAYSTGFQAFMNGLSKKASAKVEETCCSMVVKNASSSHPICGHTGLPVHKVYQDKEGNCRPLYRKGMEETYQGAIFNNSKIFG